MKIKRNRKNREGIVFSTDPDYSYQFSDEESQETILPEKQKLRIILDKKARAGKLATLITGFAGSEEDLKELGKTLRNKCGVGGTTKQNEILLQGDFRERAHQILLELGYSSSRII